MYKALVLFNILVFIKLNGKESVTVKHGYYSEILENS